MNKRRHCEAAHSANEAIQKFHHNEELDCRVTPLHSVPRNDVVVETRSWLGTPYHHQASVKGVGADCLGLIRGVWRAVHGDEPEAMPAYTSEWAEVGGVETLLEAARRHLEERPLIRPFGAPSPVKREKGVSDSPLPLAGEGGLHSKPGEGVLAPGDILLFRMRPRALVKHAGIYVGGGMFIHAYEHADVVEQELTDFWRSKIAAVFGWK